MPGKGYGKAKNAAKRNNTGLNQLVVKDDTEALFGRAVKKLGNGYFRILTTDSDGRGTEVNAKVIDKSVVLIQIGDMIVVGKNESAGKQTYEILGSLEKKTIKLLRDAKRLHPSLISDASGMEDELFDREEEEEMDVDRI